MFIRVKTTPNSPKQAVQIVASVRQGKKVSQKIVRHVGFAMDENELKNLKILAESIKLKLETDSQPLLFSPEKLSARKQADEDSLDQYNVNLKDLIEEQRLVRGIHDVYGSLFDQLGYQDIFKNPARQQATVEAFKNIVLARIANPLSKMASVDMLEEDFGISIDLQRVYRMMDSLDGATIDKLNDLTYQNTCDLFGGKIDVLFFDATTIYFESFIADELKAMGFSKDLKFNQPQILLSLIVNKEGLPLGYKVFAGNTYEGHTLIPMLKQMRERYKIDKVILVGDGGMCNKDNLEALETEGFEYIIGARLKNLSKVFQKMILDRKNYTGDDDRRIGQFEYTDKKKLIVSYKVNRAKKDAMEREKAVENLKKKLQKQANPKGYLSNMGYRKYLKVDGQSRIEIDEDKIKEASQWDGLHGVVTNAQGMTEAEILKQYVNLWHVEEAFRITKHDLKVRPVFHWTPKRIQSHLAICFTAYALVRHLEHRVKLQYKDISIEKIRQALVRVQTSVLYHVKKKVRFGLPSRIGQDAKRIYQAMNVSYLLTPWIIKKM
jgi:transposase